jgi:hypothetical protein
MNRLSLLVGLTIFNATMVAGAELGSEARAAGVHVGRATTSALLCGLNVNIRRKVEVTGDLDEKSPDEYSEGFDAGVAATADQGKLGKGPFCQREVALYGAEGSAVKGLLVTKEWKPISTFPLSDQERISAAVAVKRKAYNLRFAEALAGSCPGIGMNEREHQVQMDTYRKKDPDTFARVWNAAQDDIRDLVAKYGWGRVCESALADYGPLGREDAGLLRAQ